MSKKSNPIQWFLGTALLFSVLGVLFFLPETIASARDEINLESTYSQAKTAFANGDKTKAVQLFTNAAQAGHAESQYQLGLMYMKGWGVVRNVKDAYHWLSLAEQSGHSQAARAKEALVSQLDAETRRLLESEN
jgi:TPR repeat protein